MPRTLHFTKFILLSLALHALVLAVALILEPQTPEKQLTTPVTIVNLPQKELKQLPPLRKPAPKKVTPPPPAPARVFSERRLPPEAVPTPDKFGTGEKLTLPKTTPSQEAKAGRAKRGTAAEKTGTHLAQEPRMRGPLPFVSQKDIEELARKGMPEKKPGDDSVTLDTNEFKFISYNRWLKIKIESVLQYPELAAVSGYQGTLYIKFDILKNGSLGGVELLKSSGYKILDDEALRTIHASAPFAPLPKEWQMDHYSIRAAVIFYLGGGYIR